MVKFFISIVVINYNDSVGLKNTLDSIRVKKNDKIELVVIDGGSSDNSVNVIEEFKDIIDSGISERDKGIYDAMNKGVAYATGESVIFINSGDLLASSFDIESFINEYKNSLSEKIYYGGCYTKIKNRLFKTPANDFSEKEGKLPSHQSIFTPREFLLSNSFPTDMKISSDSFVLLKAFKVLDSMNLNDYISVFELGGVSNNWPNIKSVLNHSKEYSTVRGKNFYAIYYKFLMKYLIMKGVGFSNYYYFTFLCREVFNDIRGHNNKK